MLRTVDDVIEAVGGTAKAAALAGVKLPAVSNWRSRGQIASDKFIIFSTELERIGKTAAPSVFGLEAAEARR